MTERYVSQVTFLCPSKDYRTPLAGPPDSQKAFFSSYQHHPVWTGGVMNSTHDFARNYRLGGIISRGRRRGTILCPRWRACCCYKRMSLAMNIVNCVSAATRSPHCDQKIPDDLLTRLCRPVNMRFILAQY